MRMLAALASGALVVTVVQAADVQTNPRHGKTQERFTDGPIGMFGKYGDSYYARRWKRMCRGPARYDAMREAYDLGRPNPC